MVASNEVEEAWLDEGIDTWATTEVMNSVGLAWDFSQLLPRGTGWLLGPLVRSDVPEVAIRPPGTSRASSRPSLAPGWRFKTGSEVGRSTYGRAGAALATLEREVGRETFARIMRTYAERWAFRHPSTDDFLQLASEVSGKDLRPLGNALFRGTSGLDDAVAELRCSPVAPAWGFFDVDGGTPTFRPRSPSGPGGNVRCEVLVERRGDLPLPLEVQLTFADGTTLRQTVPPGEIGAASPPNGLFREAA